MSISPDVEFLFTNELNDLFGLTVGLDNRYTVVWPKFGRSLRFKFGFFLNQSNKKAIDTKRTKITTPQKVGKVLDAFKTIRL